MSTGVGSAHVDITATTTRAQAAIKSLVTQSQTQLAALGGVKVTTTVKLKAPTKAEVNAALSGIKSEKTVAIKIDSADAVTRIGQIKTLLNSLGTTVQGLFNVNVSGFGAILSGGTAMITQFNATVAELKKVLDEIRRARPNGPPAGGGGAGRTGGAAGASGANLNPYAAQLRALQGDLRSGALSTAQFEAATRALQTAINSEITSLRSLGALTADQQRKLDGLRGSAGQAAQALSRIGPSANAGIQQLGRDLQTAQSKYDRGALSLRAYLREMERIRTAGQGMAAGLQAGSREAQQLERVMGGLSTASRNINSASITKIRADMAAARTEFERATAAAGRFTDKRAAQQAYAQTMRELEQRIAAVGQRANITTGQVGQLNRITQQLASQRNALNGMFTPLGLSGGVLNALRTLPQFAMQAGGSLGAAAVQASTFAGGLGSIGAAAGPVGVAVAGVTAAIVGLASIAASTVGSFGTFQQNIQDAKATLGLFGQEGRAAGQQLAALAQDPALTKLGFNSNQAALAMEELGSRGLSTAEILGGGLQTAATLAAASGVKDLSVASEVLVGTMKAFGIEGAEAARVPDILANAANVSALKLEDFRLAIAAGGSAARTAGIGVTEFTAVMSLMRDRLISASDAGTSFKAFTAAFTANSSDAAAAMQKIGFTAFDSTGKMKPLRDIVEQLAGGLKGYTDEQKLATLETIFGSDGVRTATTLLDAYNTTNAEGTRLLDERTGALERQGTADLAAKERTDSLAATQAELANKVLILKQRLGEEFAPAALALVDALVRLVDWVGNLGTRLDELKGYLIPAGAALLAFRANMVATATAGAWTTFTGILTALPGLIAAVGTALRAFVASNPIGLIATVAAGVAMYANKIIADTNAAYDAIDQNNNRSFESTMAEIKRLRQLGDELSKARADVLQAQLQVQQAQMGTAKVGFWGGTTYEVDPQAVKAAELRLEAAKKELEAAQLRAKQTNPDTLRGQGPLMPGQVREGAPSDYGAKVAAQTLRATGNREADRVVDYCSRWVRMTLGKAEPKIANYVNALFQKDANRDGTVTANDAAQNARNAGLLRTYTKGSKLTAGDTVYYEDGGAGHVGIYVGKVNGVDMVRGNNRVSYAASGGKNPVGDVAMSRLGKVTGYVRADDLYGAATGYGGGAPAPTAAQAKAAANRKLLDEAQRLYNQQQAAMKAGNDAWLLKVNTSITEFKRLHADAWKTIEQTNKKGAATLAKTGVSDAEYKKFQARAKELASLEARTRGRGTAQASADREIAAWVKVNGDAAKKVLEYERGALKERTAAEKKGRDERASIAREAEQGRLESAKAGLERLKSIQNKALALAGDDAAARARIARDNANSLAAAQKQIAQAQLRADEAAARQLAPGNQAAALKTARTTYQNTLRDIETERLSTIRESGKTLKEEQSKLDQQLREGRVADARLTVERIEQLNERELINFKGTAEQRRQLVVRQANAEAAARKKVALAQKGLDDAAARKLDPSQQAAALSRSKATYENALREIENTRLRAVQDAGKTLKDEQSRLDQQLREGRVADARLTVERIQQLNERELINFKGTAAQRQQLVVRQANAEADAKKRVALAQKALDDAAARELAPGQQTAALARSRTTYENALRDIENVRLRAVQEAGKTLKEEQGRLDQQLREGRVADARLTVERIEKLHERELLNFKGTATARQQLVIQQANSEAAARKKVALAQKALDDAAARQLDPGQQAAALARSKSTYENSLREIENTRLRAVQDANKTIKEEQDKFNQEVREGRVADARLTLEKIQQFNQQELDGFVGTAAQREQVIRRQADSELEAKKSIALAQKSIDDAAARALAPGLQAAALARSQATYQNAVRQAQLDRNKLVQEAKKATADEVREAGERQKAASNLERELRQLNERFEEQVRSGTVTTDSLLRYRQALEDAGAKAADLPPAIRGIIGTLLTQGGTLASSGQQVADYRSEIDKLKTSVDDWAYAELLAARARVVASGGDEKKLAILDAEIAKRKTLTTQQLDQVTAESRVTTARSGQDTLEGEYSNQQAAAKGNYTTLYQLALQYEGRIQEARDTRVRAEAESEERVINEKYDKLSQLEGISDDQLRELDAARTRDLEANAQRLTNALAKNASDRAAAELEAKTRLDDTLKAVDRQTRDTIRKNNLDLLTRQTDDGEAAQEEELSQEGLTQQQILDIRKKHQPLLVALKRRELAASREIEEQAERDRYNDAVTAAQQNGTLAQVQEQLLAEHTSNMGAIQRRSTDALRDYELSTKREVGKAIVASDKATSDELVEVAKGRIDQQLEGLSDMDERQRQLARSTLEFWRGVYDGMGATGKAALAAVDEAIAKLNSAGSQARTKASEVVILDDRILQSDFTRDLRAVGKDEDEGDARASAEEKYKELLDRYRGYLSKAQAAFKQFEGVADEALSPDELQTRDGLLANMQLLQQFLDEVVIAASEAGDKAAVAFTQAQSDRRMEGQLALTEAEYARAQQEGQDGSPAYRAGLNAALVYWKARKEGLDKNSPEYLAALQKVTELEGKLSAVSPEKIRDQEEERSLAILEARHTLAESEGRDDSPSYRAGLNAALAYWRARLKGLAEGSPDYLAALQKVAELEAKVAAVSPEKIRDQEEERSLALLEARHALAEAEGRDDSPAYLAGLKASLAYWRARLLGLKEGTPDYLAALQKIADLEGKVRAGAKGPLGARLQEAAQILGTSGPVKAALSAGLNGLAAFFDAGGRAGGRGAILTGAAAFVGGLVDVFKTGDEDVDQVVGGFVSGLQSTLMQLATGNWVGALISGVATVVGTVVDIFRGGRNSARKAAQEISDATKDIRFFDLGKYARVESRGGFLGWLGFKQSTIDQEAVGIAKTLGDAIYTSITTGMLEGIKAGKGSFRDLGLDLKKGLSEQILQGLIDGFLKGAVMQGILQPFLDAYIEAMKTGNGKALADAAAGIQAAVNQSNSALQQFYNDVLVPTAKSLGTFGSDVDKDSNLGGNASTDLGITTVTPSITATSNTDAFQSLAGAIERYVPRLEAASQTDMETAARNAANTTRLERLLSRLELRPNGSFR